ncbi:substrate-binding domain-containing protein [Paraglaciecola aquimarina]|uniref:Substrate-binding domain-containing protein n=1 Tax=Paraglaciecola aquimarina TaxID=1235557 RepID=A0ABU3SVZ6_9ALTE|nr:substrate-binding domain-containing protein [Paraglaciecola aquimarina]MDU0354193.1 substrate-binding domain-containing protein [Paraglaciecola aquimarina]
MARQRNGGRTAAEYLLEKGHTKIALITSTYRNRDPQARIKGVQQGLAPANLTVPDSRIIYAEPNIDAAIASTQQLLASGEEFTAIIAYNDMMAVGVAHALQQAGKRVPEDISIIGFDNLFVCSTCQPQLTTLDYPIAEMATYATQLTIELTNKANSIPSRTHLFMPELRERNSVADLN